MSYTDSLKAAWGERTLTKGHLEQRLEELAGWREDARDLIREGKRGTYQKTLEQLAICMTEEETRAWHALYRDVAALMTKLAYKEWVRHAQHERATGFDDALGYLPLVFLRCLVDYDPERAHLTTHLHIAAPAHLRCYLVEVIDRAAATTDLRRERVFEQIGNALFTRCGRAATPDELVREVRARDTWMGRATPETIRRHAAHHLEERDPLSLDAPREGEAALKDSLADVHEERRDLFDVAGVARELAARWGKEELWARLNTEE